MDPIGLKIERAAYNHNQNTLTKELPEDVVTLINDFHRPYDESKSGLTYANAITGLQKFHTELRPKIDQIFNA